MYTDIVTYSFITIVIIALLSLYGISLIERKRLKYKKSIFIKKSIKTTLLLLLTIYNLLFAFAQIKYVWHLLVIIGSNSLAALFFVVDLLYFSQRKRAYVVWMQKQLFNQTSFDEIFECLDDDGGEYNEEREDPFQKYPIVNLGRTNGYCIRYEEDNNHYFLKPKIILDKDVLNLYAQRIELENKKMKDLNVYNSNNIPTFVCKEYDKCEDINSYSFIEHRLFESFLFWFVAIVFVLAIEVVVVLLATYYSNQCGGFEEWLRSPICLFLFCLI